MARSKNLSLSSRLPSEPADPGALPEVTVSDDGEVRHLHLGTPWIQGSMRVKDPFELELEYIQRMMAWLLFVDPASVAERHAMQLGLGAGAITKFCHKKLRMCSTAIELNPQVLAVCRSWFKLPPDGPTLRVVLAQRTATPLKRAELALRCEAVQARWDLPAAKWGRVFGPVAA